MAAALNLVLADGIQPGVTTPVTVYSPLANTNGARITACTVYNPTSSTPKFSIYIVPAGGTAVAQYEIIHQQSLTAGETVALPEVINQLIPPGGFLAIATDTIATTAIRASGILF